jgi:hypothetical protein
MSEQQPKPLITPDNMPDGSGAAAILSAGIGCFVLGVLAIAADKSATMKHLMNLYQPTGPLSGVTTAAIAIWLLSWGILEWRWGSRTVALRRINTIAFVLLGLSLLLTFPPIADLLRGL